jgi:hypothetical protein
VIVTDYIILATAALSLAAAIIGAARSFYNSSQIKHNSSQIQEVHLVMNSRMTAALSRIEQLGDALQKSGVTIPPDPSLNLNVKGESS